MRFYVVFVVILVFGIYFVTSLTEEQLASAGKLVRSACKPESQATDEQIDNMKKGIWDDSPEQKAYAFCLLHTIKLMYDNGTFDMQGAVKHLELLPKERQEPVMNSAANCHKEDTIKPNKHDTAYYFLKCIYFDNPANYFAP